MNKIIQEFQKYTYLFPPFQRWLNKRQQTSDMQSWMKKMPSLPLPHLMKQDILKGYAVEYGLSILVETGTYRGEMIDALYDHFKEIYSIELSEMYSKRARIYFQWRKKVKIIQGDSGNVIAELIHEIKRPALFWLDGHYSAGDTAKGEKSTPVLNELRYILSAEDLRHVILVDDARAFGKAEDYPSLDELKDFVFSFRKNVEIINKDDIIRILPK